MSDPNHQSCWCPHNCVDIDRRIDERIAEALERVESLLLRGDGKHATLLKVAAELRAAEPASEPVHVAACENCGESANGYTPDDVPLCNRCGREIDEDEKERASNPVWVCPTCKFSCAIYGHYHADCEGLVPHMKDPEARTCYDSPALEQMREVYDALERHGYANPQSCTIETIVEEVNAGRAAAGRAAEAQMELAELRTRVAALERVDAAAGLVLEAWRHDRVASEMQCQIDALSATMERKPK